MNQTQVCASSGTCLFKKHFSIPFLNNQNPFLGKCILNILSFFVSVRFFPQKSHHSPTLLQDLVKKCHRYKEEKTILSEKWEPVFLLTVVFTAEIQLKTKDTAYMEKIF